MSAVNARRRRIWIVVAVVVTGAILATALWFVTPSENDCFVADRIETLSTRRYLGKTYSVRLVTSGFQDKTRAVHLYEEPVTFNVCGKPSREPLTTEAVDQGGGYPVLRKVRVRSPRQIEVVVTQDPDDEHARPVEVDWALAQ